MLRLLAHKVANSYLTGFCGFLPPNMASTSRDPSQHHSPDTPLVDEPHQGYSPISAVGEEPSCSSTGMTHRTNTPGLFKPSPIPSGSPTKRRRTDEGADPNVGAATPRLDVVDALAAMETRIMSEFAALRNDVAVMRHKLDGLSPAIEENNGSAHTYARHIQQDLADGVNHLTSVLTGRREKMQKASSILRSLLDGETSSAATSPPDAQ